MTATLEPAATLMAAQMDEMVVSATRVESRSEPVARANRAGQVANAQTGEWLYAHKSVHASFFHTWFDSHPRAVVALFGAELILREGECHA